MEWRMENENTKLIISGTGDMQELVDSNEGTIPWKTYASTITTVIIEEGITSICDSAFYNCKKLTEITIPNSVTSIGQSAFYNCNRLTEITIPNSVTSIGQSAFYYCKSLTEITIPDSVTSIGARAFLKCKGLININVDSANSSYSSDEYGVLFDKNKTKLIQYSIGNIREIYNIPDSVTSIEKSAFNGCTSLIEITIPDSVTSIGEDVFNGCTSLIEITIPDSVTSIGEDVFNGCTSLIEITIPDGVTSIGNSAFYYCTSLINITIPNSVTSIGYLAFNGCTSLTEITIPDSVTSIGDSAFLKCKGLININVDSANSSYSSDEYGVLFDKNKTKLIQYSIGNIREIYNIPDSVTSIEKSAFNGCTSLIEITIPDSVTSIEKSAFNGCTSLIEITIPDGVTSIGEDVFNGCTSLIEITIPDSVTSIGQSAFYYCTSLTEITIPNGVTSIGNSAFYRCLSLTKVDIPDSVTSIGQNAFYNCTSLTKVDIPDGVTSIKYSTFESCDNLIEITIPDSVTSIEYEVFRECSSLTKVNIPNGVTSIANSTFWGCGNLTEVNIPDGVISIGNSAFCHCTSLTKVDIPDSVTSIGQSAFYYCTSLIKVNIPDGVTSIGEKTFYECQKLTEIIIPDSVESIGESAFYRCESLSTVYYNGTEEYWETLTIGINNECLKNAIIYYKTIEKFIINLSEIQNYCEIGKYAFENRTGIRELTISNNVSFIGEGALKGLINLKSLSIPFIGEKQDSKKTFNHIFGSKVPKTLEEVFITGGIEIIPSRCFLGLTSIKKIELPETLREIGSEAFKNTGIINMSIPSLVDTLGGECFNTETLKTISWYTVLPKLTEDKVDKPYDYSSYFSRKIEDKIKAYGYRGLTAFQEENGTQIIYGTEKLTEEQMDYYDEETGYFYKESTKETIMGFAPILSRIFNQNISDFQGVCGENGGNLEYMLEPIEVIEGEIYYKININGTGKMFNFSTIENVPWNSYRDFIQEIKINVGVTSISDYAFSNCIKVKSIDIPETIVTIGTEAFKNMGTETFKGVETEKTTINSSKTLNLLRLEQLGSKAFEGCQFLEKIELEKGSLIKIGEQAFKDCINLKSVVFPSNEIVMEKQIFQGCYNLRDLSMPMPCNVSLALAENYLKLNKTDLEKVYQLYNIGGLFDLEEPEVDKKTETENTMEKKYFSYDWVIPTDGAKGKGEIFKWSDGSQNTTFSQTYYVPVTLKNFTLLNLSNQPTCMPMYYLWRGDNQKSLWETLVFKVEPTMFYWNTSDTTYTNGTKSHNFSVHSGGELAGVSAKTIEKKIFGDKSYWNCNTYEDNYKVSSELFFSFSSKKRFPKTIEKIICSEQIDMSSWSSATEITEVDCSSATFTDLDLLGSYLTYTITYLRLPSTVTSISSCKRVKNLIGNKNGEEITIKHSAFMSGIIETVQDCKIVSIEYSSFEYCSNLISISKITSKDIIFPQDTFYDCGKLVSIDFEEGSGVSVIERWALDKTSNLQKAIPCSEKGISIGYAINNSKIKFSYKGEEGVIAINQESDSATVENANVQKLIILNTVKSLKASICSGCTKLEKVVFEEGSVIHSIGNYAFQGCTGLTSINIPNSVTSIGYRAFQGCTNLTNITIPDSVTSIDDWAFENCTNLTNIEIPNSVTSIGMYAFYNCKNLTNVEILNGVTRIDYQAFYNCKNLTNIEIPNSVTSIEYQAFYNCKNLTNIEIPNSVTSIGGGAFQRCSLTNVRVPNSVTYIGYGAFSDYCGEWIELPFIGNYVGTRYTREKVLAYVFADSTNNSSSISAGGESYSVPNKLKKVYISNSTKIPRSAFENWASRTTGGLTQVYFKQTPTVIESDWNKNSGVTNYLSYPNEEDLPWNNQAIGYSRTVSNNLAKFSLVPNTCLYLNYNKEYLWNLKLIGKQYDVYVTDNNTYAEEYSFLPTIYAPNHNGLEIGQCIDVQGENTYKISDIKQFRHTGSVFHRQSKGILNGKINYYSVNNGTLTYLVDKETYEVDSTLEEQLTEKPIDFASDVEYSTELHKGTICKKEEKIIVTLEEGIAPKFFEFGQTISLRNSLVTTASLDVALLNIVKEGTQFVVANSNQIQTVDKIDELYNISFSPGFSVSSSGYVETQITLADKTLILPSDIKNTEVVVVVNKKGVITITGDLEEEVKKCNVEEHLLSLITIDKEDITQSTYFELQGNKYYFTQVDVKNKLAYFEDDKGQGYIVPNQIEFEYEVVLQNEQDLSVMDVTDLHLTLNYINIFEIKSIKQYTVPNGIDFGLEDGEILYLVNCKEVVNATNYEVNARNLEKEAVIERYSTILTVETLEGTTPQSIIIPPNTSYTVYSNSIKTPSYYFESMEKQPLIVKYSNEIISDSLTMKSGSGLFEASYEGSVLTCTWTLYEYYKGDYIQINQVVNQYSPNLFYNYHLFEHQKQYKLVVQVLTKEGLIINKEIDIEVNHEVALEINGIKVEKDCVRKALAINLRDVEIKITDLKLGYNICPRSWLDDGRVYYKIKELYVLRKNKDDESENTVLAKVQGFPYYIYDYSFSREDNYEYSIIPVYYDTRTIEEKDLNQHNLMRGVPSKITGEDNYNVKNIVLIGTKLDLRENTQDTEVLYNNYEVDFEPDVKWYFNYNTDARNVTIVTDKNTYETISPYATVNYTDRNYKSGTVMAFLGSFHKDGEDLSEWTYKDSIRLQNKFQKFANNGKIKMLRDEIGNVIPVDITLKSFEYNSHSKPTNITVTFDWVQVGEESQFIVYEADYNIPTKGVNH